MSVRRLRPAEAAQAIDQNHQADAARQQMRRDLEQGKLDAEDRQFYAGLRWFARWRLRRRRAWVSLFVRQMVAKAHERGTINLRQGKQIIRLTDNRLNPDKK